jgi:Zn-dependent M28 family amino/carboxypeptidase
MKNYILLICAFFVACATSQENNSNNPVIYAESITAKELKDHLYVYASDEFEGRETGTPGETVAINYLKSQYKALDIQGGMPNGDYFMPMTLNAYRENTTIDCNNVLAYIEGSEKPEELLVITAHLDHIGVEDDGQINNGADDDGSGTVAILEIAEAFQMAAQAGVKPKRSILFLHVTGEEKGLLGSKFYTDNPVYPLENTVANLNIDMIGRIDDLHKDNPNYLYLIGSDILSQDLHDVSAAMNDAYINLDLDYRYNDPTTEVFERGRYIQNRYYYRSDHYNFAKNEVPVIFYFNGTHEDYHAPTDTVEKIEYDLLEKRTRLIFHTAWEIVNRDERLRLKD